MQPVLFKVCASEEGVVQVQNKKQAHHYDKWHYHPECQISLVLDGKGICSIGDSAHRFQAKEIYLIGSNVPHVFYNDEDHYESVDLNNSHIVSLFFKMDAFKSLLALEEMKGIRQVLEEAKNGVRWSIIDQEWLADKIFSFTEASATNRVLALLGLLQSLSQAKHKEILQGEQVNALPVLETYQPLRQVFRYIYDNFDRPISLEEVAKVANLSKYAFCRYFKRSTHKSFVTYLNEFRVRMACKMIYKGQDNIAQVGFLVGFNNLSNFNRQFKKVMNCTPSSYRKYVQRLFSACF